jgi:hypothetical protein
VVRQKVPSEGELIGPQYPKNCDTPDYFPQIVTQTLRVERKEEIMKKRFLSFRIRGKKLI